jgi:methionine synthase II (cobalamin-independent)
MDVSKSTVPFRPNWLPICLGSLPYTDVNRAWDAILQRFPEIPTWPQLPRKSNLENRYVQFSERFPGLTLEDGDRIHIDRERNLDRGLERLYLAYLEDDREHGRINGSHAAGLEALRRGEVQFPRTPLALKGTVTGPVSWSLTVVDRNQRPILYDEVLLDAVGKHLRLKAAWQEQELRRLAPATLLFLDEPYMASYRSTAVSLTRDEALALFEEVLAGLEGLKGMHCCGNTDWGIVLSTSIDVLSLDAYDYGHTLVPYIEDLARFLNRGGTVAWGIVPAGIAAERETVDSLVAHLQRTIEMLAEAGAPRDALLERGLVSPSCGLGALTPALAKLILDMTVGVSQEMRRLYGGSKEGANPSLLESATGQEA